MRADHQLRLVVDVVHALLGDTLVSVALAGSAVAGGLRQLSDLDLLVVVDRPLADPGALARALLDLSGSYGAGGLLRPLDVTVLDENVLRTPASAPRRELLYGEWLRTEIEAGRIHGPAEDPGVLVLLASARARHEVLYGAPLHIAPIDPGALRGAFVAPLPGLLEDVPGDDRTVLRTLARMWFTAVTGEITSKDVAAMWAIARTDAATARMLSIAHDGYCGVADEDVWDGRADTVRCAADVLRLEIERSCE